VEFHNYYRRANKYYLVEFHDIDKVFVQEYNIFDIVAFHESGGAV